MTISATYPIEDPLPSTTNYLYLPTFPQESITKHEGIKHSTFWACGLFYPYYLPPKNEKMMCCLQVKLSNRSCEKKPLHLPETGEIYV